MLRAIQQLVSHIAAVPDSDTHNDDDDDCDDGDDVTESVFDMECQNIGTHVAGYSTIQHETQHSVNDETTTGRSSPIFRRRSIHDVKPTAGLQALHEYDGCDQDDDSEDPLPSSAAQVEEIIVPVGFNSKIIKFVNIMLSFVISASC